MNIGVVDDEVIVQKRLQASLEKEGHRVKTYGSGEDFLRDLELGNFDLVFLDVVLPGLNGMEVLQQIKSRLPETEVILITGQASIDAAVGAIKKGAFHYVAKPLKLEDIRNLAHRALEHKLLVTENRQLKARLEPLEGWGEMIGVSPKMKEVFHISRKVAPLDCNVIIQGESGTGKELVARLIHRESARRSRPFVAFNCGGEPSPAPSPPRSASWKQPTGAPCSWTKSGICPCPCKESSSGSSRKTRLPGWGATGPFNWT
jgi:two-component system response regulator AtoC